MLSSIFSPDVIYLYIALLCFCIASVLKAAEFYDNPNWSPFNILLDLPNKWCRRIARLTAVAGVVLLILQNYLVAGHPWGTSIFIGLAAGYCCMVFGAMLFLVIGAIVYLLFSMIFGYVMMAFHWIVSRFK